MSCSSTWRCTTLVVVFLSLPRADPSAPTTATAAFFGHPCCCCCVAFCCWCCCCCCCCCTEGALSCCCFFSASSCFRRCTCTALGTIDPNSPEGGCGLPPPRRRTNIWLFCRMRSIACVRGVTSVPCVRRGRESSAPSSEHACPSPCDEETASRVNSARAGRSMLLLAAFQLTARAPQRTTSKIFNGNGGIYVLAVCCRHDKCWPSSVDTSMTTSSRSQRFRALPTFAMCYVTSRALAAVALRLVTAPVRSISPIKFVELSLELGPAGGVRLSSSTD